MGRKKLGNVLFAKRVSPAMAARLAEVIALDSKASGVPGGVGVGGNGERGLKGQGKLDGVVLEQAARIEELEGLLREARSRAMEPQGEEGVYWKMKYLEAKRRVEELERMGEG